MCVVASGQVLFCHGRGAVVVCPLCALPRLWLFVFVYCLPLLVVRFLPVGWSWCLVCCLGRRVCGGCLQLRSPIVVVSG